MKRLWLAAYFRRDDSGVVWKSCACSSVSAVPAAKERSDTTGESARIKKDDLPTNSPKRGDVEAPVSLQDDQRDSHRVSTEDETLNSKDENTEHKLNQPDRSPERLDTEKSENPTVQSAEPEQIHKRRNSPQSRGSTPDQSTKSGPEVSIWPNLKKTSDKKKSVEYICAKYGKSFCKPTQLIKYQRTYIGDNSAMFNELGKYFNRFSATDQKTDMQVQEKSSTCSKKENILNSPPSLQIQPQEKTIKQEKPSPSTNNETNVTKSPPLVLHQDTHTSSPESVKRFKKLSSPKKRPEKQNKTQYLCMECEKSFTAYSSLQRHKDIHLGKRYPCLECGKTYGRVSSLKKHQVSHTENPPHLSTKHGTNVQTDEKPIHLPGDTSHQEKLNPSSV